MNKRTSAQKKLVSYLKQRDPQLTDSEVPLMLNSIKRFVLVVQKLHREPQAQITVKDLKKDGLTIRTRIISTDMEEFKKVLDNETGDGDIIQAFRKFNKSVTKDKYGR